MRLGPLAPDPIAIGANAESLFSVLEGRNPPEAVRSDASAAEHAPNAYAVTVHRFAKPGHDLVRAQQVGEGWFDTIDAVPERAVSMSVRQILKAREIVVVVPDARKAAAVKAALEGPISPVVPASALRWHERATLYLDEPAASRLAPSTRLCTNV